MEKNPKTSKRLRKPRTYRVEIYEVPHNKKQAFRFRIVAPNGKVIVPPERYRNKVSIKTMLHRFFTAVNGGRVFFGTGVWKP